MRGVELQYQLLDAFPSPPTDRTIKLSLSYAQQRLGQALSSEQAVKIFEALGLKTTQMEDVLSVRALLASGQRPAAQG